MLRFVDNVVLTQQKQQNGSVPVGVVEFEHINYSTGACIMTTLREKMKQEMILRGYSHSTQDVYLRSVVKLHDYFNRNPAELTEEEIKEFLLFTLANKSISASTYNIIIHGLKFFYERVLDKKIVAMKIPRRKEPQKLPDILSAAEVEQIIKATSNIKYRTLFILIYGAGLRISEAASLCIEDIDSVVPLFVKKLGVSR